MKGNSKKFISNDDRKIATPSISWMLRNEPNIIGNQECCAGDIEVKIPNKREPDNKFVMCSSTTETFLMKKNEEVNLNKTSLLLRERKRSRRNGALNQGQTEFFSEN
ncbi:hypothetical protein SNEBB_003891 [Seison nebaliae]|nr:hypothetical protein SNEBB_003891 [Seison nebaliae]